MATAFPQTSGPESIEISSASPGAISDFNDAFLLLGCFIGTFLAVAFGAWVAVSLSPKPVASGSTGAGASPGHSLGLVAYSRGKRLFATSCVTCHGPNATGVAKLGKDLVRSKFVHRSTDAELATFIEKGRLPNDPRNTTGVPMPPKGGNANLSSRDLTEIVVYLRGLASPLSVPEGEAPAEALADLPAEPTPAIAAAAPAAVEIASATPVVAEPAPIAVSSSPSAEANASDPEAINRGKRAFVSCVACHGKDGTGMKGLGKDLVHSEFIGKLNDDELMAFVKKGRGPTDPDNTTKVGMPPKGGNPALNDKQLKDLIAYIRSLRQPKSS